MGKCTTDLTGYCQCHHAVPALESQLAAATGEIERLKKELKEEKAEHFKTIEGLPR